MGLVRINKLKVGVFSVLSTARKIFQEKVIAELTRVY